MGQWSETTPDQKRQKIQRNTENCVPIVVPGLSTCSSSSTASTSPTSLPQDLTEDSTSGPATIRLRSTSSPELGDQLRGSEQPKGAGKDTDQVHGTCCAIFQNGWRMSQNIWWTKDTQELLVIRFGTSKISGIGETVFLLTFRRTEIAK